MALNRPTEEEIRVRAYQIYVERGRQDGHDIDDWLQAEYELTQLPVHKVVELAAARPSRGGKSAKKSLAQVVTMALL